MAAGHVSENALLCCSSQLTTRCGTGYRPRPFYTGNSFFSLLTLHCAVNNLRLLNQSDKTEFYLSLTVNIDL